MMLRAIQKYIHYFVLQYHPAQYYPASAVEKELGEQLLRPNTSLE